MMRSAGRNRRTPTASQTETAPTRNYRHPTAESPLRPEVGTQAQFRKKKPPVTYRYDPSLSPALDWDAQNGARELGKWLLACIEEAREPQMANNYTTDTDLAYADTLWMSADALRGQVDAVVYKHVVLGLLFLKYISDSFDARREELEKELEADGITGDQLEQLLENRDEYTAERVFWVPPEARWANLQNQATRSDIATLIDDAILAVERDNPNSRATAPRHAILSAGFTNTSSANSPRPKESWAANSTRRVGRCACWSRCSNPTRAASTTLAAAQAACSCSPRSSSSTTAARSRTAISSFSRRAATGYALTAFAHESG
jgi:hypothetical protein